VSARLLIVLLALVACGKKSDDDTAPTCAQVVDHMLVITKQEMIAGHDGMGGKMKAQMVAQCETGPSAMSAELRHCVINAKDVNALGECTAKTGTPPPRRPQ
jgi:hypothetical protein